jgi:hypothetical protein
MRKLMIAALLAASGSAQAYDLKYKWAPFLEVELGREVFTKHKNRYNDDCDYPVSFSFGVDSRYGIEIGLQHKSTVDCGPPFNRENELTTDVIFVRYKLGGF